MKHLKLFEAYDHDIVTVNIWDDYKQEPEYDVTNDTHMYVEGDFPKSLVSSIIKQVHEHIKDNIDLDGVTYKVVSRESTFDGGTVNERKEKRDELRISGLNYENREELLKRLKKSKMKFVDTKIDFISSS